MAKIAVHIPIKLPSYYVQSFFCRKWVNVVHSNHVDFCEHSRYADI